MMLEAPPPEAENVKLWKRPVWDVCGRDGGLIFTSACTCAWPWSLTAIGSKLRFYPYTSRRHSFFCLMLFLVALHYVADSVANVMMAQSNTLEKQDEADEYEIIYGILGLLMSLTGMAICFAIVQLRVKTRQNQKIEGHILDDACCSCCCPCCVVLQMGREMGLRSDEICISVGDEVVEATPARVKIEL